MFANSRRSALTTLTVACALIAAACSPSSGPVAIERDQIAPGDADSGGVGLDDAAPDDPDENGSVASDDPADDPGDDPGGSVSTDDGDPTDEDTPRAPRDSLDWTRCEDIDDPSLECAVLGVPLDHDDHLGEHIELSLVRLPASGTRVGAVLLNPGGPGGSGIDFAVALAAYAALELGLQGYDIIGFDPRGVDRSTGLRCLSDAEMDELLFPTGDSDGLDDDRFATACVEQYGDTLRHFSTLNTARDMERIRIALGDDQVSYIGISYGTYLGAAYATLFPDRVRAMVLDSGFEPTGDTLEQRYLTQLIGFEEAFDAWAADCETTPDCAFTARPVDAGWDELRARLDDQPLIGEDGRAATGSVVETATIAALYSPAAWSRLAAALRDADTGDPGGLFELADAYVGRNPDGTYGTIQQSNRIISCASGFGAAVPDDPEALAELIRTSAPRWGGDVDADSFGDRCASMMDPVELPELGFDGDAPILVIGGVNDPATPFRWSEELAETMGPSALLATWNGEGHGMLFGSNCLMGLASDVLVLRLTWPDGEVCDPDPDIPRPAFWDDLPIPDGVSAEPLGPEAMDLLGLPSRLVYGEARTSTLPPDELLRAYREALLEQGFQALGREEPIPGLIVVTYLDRRFLTLSIIVLADEVYEDPELAPAQRLIEDGETLFALISFG